VTPVAVVWLLPNLKILYLLYEVILCKSLYVVTPLKAAPQITILSLHLTLDPLYNPRCARLSLCLKISRLFGK
jgi:hypothetical protein